MLALIKKEFSETFKFRRVLYSFLVNSFRVKYRRSSLGFFWAVISPIVQFSTLGIVFSWILNINDTSYVTYFLSGIIFFGLIGGVLNASPNIFIGNEVFIKKIYLPKLIFALQSVFYESIVFWVTFFSMLVVGLFAGRLTLSWSYFYILFLFFFIVLFLVGISLLMGLLSVQFHDMKHIFPAIVLGLFYGTPIFYKPEIIPEKLKFIVILNPFFYIIECFRIPILNHELPPWSYSIFVVLLSLIVFVAGMISIVKQSNRIIFKL